MDTGVFSTSEDGHATQRERDNTRIGLILMLNEHRLTGLRHMQFFVVHEQFVLSVCVFEFHKISSLFCEIES